MASKFSHTQADYGAEKSTATFFGPTITAANHDATVTAIQGVWTGIEGITIGLPVKEQIISLSTGAGSGQSTNPLAQRELKWLVSYTDDVTGKLYQSEIPCPDLSLLDPSARGYLNIGAGAGATFVANLEAIAQSPDGNAITVQNVRLVGRNL